MYKKYDIILNFYKDYKFLKNCLKNINNQTSLPNILIFTDDGNNDPYLRYFVKKNLNKKIKLDYIQNKKNLGPEACTENAIKKIKSYFFYHQSTDDIHYKNFAEESIKILKKYRSAPYSFSNIVINNLFNKRKYYLKYHFIKSGFYKKKKVEEIFKNYQFKIHHNTVMFNTRIFMKYNIFKKEYGARCDMLNLIYLAKKFGFAYNDTYLSEYTFRKNQYGQIKSDKYLINELVKLKKINVELYNYLIKCNLHYDLSIFSMFKIIKNNIINIISLVWFLRSIKFFLWKKIRFLIPNRLLTFLFKIFS